jgi:hypothetical protein
MPRSASDVSTSVPVHFPDFPLTGFRSRTLGPPPFSSVNSAAQPQPKGKPPTWARACAFVKGFAEFDVVLRHVRRDVAALEERQDPVGPSGMAFGCVPLGTLRSRALSSSVEKPPGGFDFERKNRNEVITIDVDE